MSEYYAVIRSTDHLAHYGVKGMKWGVRKSIMKGNERRLARHYKKAAKKLAKLDAKANTKLQQEKAHKYGKVAKIAGTVGAAGLATAGASKIYQNDASKKFNKDAVARIHELYPGKYHDGTPASNGKAAITTDLIRETTINDKKLHETWNRHFNKVFNAQQIGAVASGIGALGTAAAIGAGAKALAAKRRTTTAGHAAAVARRNEFKREMKDAFKGTKYQDLPDYNQSTKKSKKKKSRKYFTKQDFKDAAKSAGLSLIMGPGAAMYTSSRRSVASSTKKRKG